MNEFSIHNAMESRDSADAEAALREIDRTLEECADTQTKATLQLRKAVLCGILHRFDDAETQLRLALENAPDDADIRLQSDFIRGSLADQKGDPQDALTQLTQVLSLYSARFSEPDLRFMYEDIQLRRGLDAVRVCKFKEAVPILEECLSFNLKVEERSSVLSNIGLCYSELGEYELARDYLLRARKFGVGKDWNGHVQMHLAIAYARLKLFRQAKEELLLCERNASEFGLPISKIYEWLSWVSRGLGEKRESEEYARLARLC
jgi:tetratricopeptide (TPR) repeat protein